MKLYDDPCDGERRRVIRIAVAGGVAAGLGGLAALPAHAEPAPGDLLVADGVEGDPVPLKPGDVQIGTPVLAFPYDAAAKKVRSDSRLAKVMLVRVEEKDLDAESRKRAAGGVLAYSAICTHQACEIKTWLPADKSVICFCHSSKFLPLEGARVADGPAPRALPSLPLSLKDDRLAVAGPFSAPPGVRS